MSETFDEVAEASWARFEERVTACVPEIGPVDHTIGLARPGEYDAPLASVQGWDDHVRVELVGLSGAHDLAAVKALGWQPPEEPEDSPFWAVTLPVAESAVLAGMLSGVLRRVFGITDPAFLSDDLPSSTERSERAAGRQGHVGDPEPAVDMERAEVLDDELVMGHPESHDELVELVRRTLVSAYGPTVCRDDDGDFPICSGVVPFWVRVLDDAPVLRIFSFPVRSVRDVRQARIEVGVLNRRTPLLKFYLEDGVITATYDLPAVPFVGSQLLHVLEGVTRWLDDLAEDTALRVGGRLWVSTTEDQASSSERET